MNEPIHAAVEWWAAQLMGDVEHDAGDDDINYVTRGLSKRLHPADPQSVNQFKRYLFLLCRAAWEDCWYPENPKKASAIRTIQVDYHPDYLLHSALVLAHINSGNLRLPIKTTMWVRPDKVEVSCGYGARAEIIWEAESEVNDE